MARPSIFKSDLSWFAAEGTKGGLPILIRGRSFAGTDVRHAGLPFALEITLPYHVDHEVALPSPSEYARIKAFEARVIDEMEAAELGVVALVETCGGAVTYLVYLRDGDDACGSVDQFVRDDDGVDYAGDEDPDWARYADKMKRIQGLSGRPAEG